MFIAWITSVKCPVVLQPDRTVSIGNQRGCRAFAINIDWSVAVYQERSIMRLHRRPPNMFKKAYVHALDLPASSNTDEQYGREFRDFIESITVTAEELAAIISMPEFSIQEVKQFLQDSKNSGPQNNSSSLGCVVRQVFVDIPPQAGGYSTLPLINVLPRLRLAPVADTVRPRSSRT
jgi:hypothetical protein